jgi:hypothetical protein
MMPLPWVAWSPLAWRLDLQPDRSTWDRGIGAAKVGGRWNPVGYPIVYCSADPATAMLELAVHKGFAALDTVPHALTRARLLNVADVHVTSLVAASPSECLDRIVLLGEGHLRAAVRECGNSGPRYRSSNPCLMPRFRSRTNFRPTEHLLFALELLAVIFVIVVLLLAIARVTRAAP